jgi:outer membrane protein assembly factor BamD (BamD/ComL family)
LENAQKLEDPQQEIDALNTLVADFPTSRYAKRAKTLILEIR